MTTNRSLLTRYRQLSFWGRLAAWGSVASIISVAALFMFPQSPRTTLTSTVKRSANTTVIQSGRDTVITGSVSKLTSIQSLVVEGRLTCTLKPRAELPPAEVHFDPLGGSNAYLEGPPGRAALVFASPVRFRRLEDDRVTLINRFGLPTGSDLHNAPLERLASFTNLLVPSESVVYGAALDKMTMFEVTITANGEQLWAHSYPLQEQFEQLKGKKFAIPLEDLAPRLRQGR